MIQKTLRMSVVQLNFITLLTEAFMVPRRAHVHTPSFRHHSHTKS